MKDNFQYCSKCGKRSSLSGITEKYTWYCNDCSKTKEIIKCACCKQGITKEDEVAVYKESGIHCQFKEPKEFEITEKDHDGRKYNALLFYGREIPCVDISVHDEVGSLRTVNLTVVIKD